MLLLALGLTTLGLAYRQGWWLLPWAGALPADLGFAVAAVGISAHRFEISPFAAILLPLSLFAGYLALFSSRTLKQGQEVGAFEAAQTVLAGLIGLGGALRISESYGYGAAIPGSAALALGIAAYGVAFSRITRSERRRNFFFYTTLALGLVAVGSLAFLEPPQAALVWSALGVICAVLSRGFKRVTLSLHCMIYLLAAMFASGLARAATDAYWRPDPADWSPLGPIQWAVILSMAVCVAIPAARTSRSWGRLATVPRAALLLFTVWAIGGALLGSVAPGALRRWGRSRCRSAGGIANRHLRRRSRASSLALAPTTLLRGGVAGLPTAGRRRVQGPRPRSVRRATGNTIRLAGVAGRFADDRFTLAAPRASYGAPS